MRKLLFFALSLMLLSAVPACTTKSLLQGGEILPGIIGRIARPLAVDNDNVVWIASNTGVSAFHDNQFQTFGRLQHQRLPLIGVTSILVDNVNKKWFGNSTGDIFTYDNHKWEILPTFAGVTYISAIRKDSSGDVWVLGNNGALWSYKEGAIDKTLNVAGSDMVIDAEDNLWVTSLDGLLRFNGQTWENLKSALPMPSADRMVYDKNNKTIYFASSSYGKGEGIFAYKNGQFEVVATEATGLPSAENIDCVIGR